MFLHQYHFFEFSGKKPLPSDQMSPPQVMTKSLLRDFSLLTPPFPIFGVTLFPTSQEKNFKVWLELLPVGVVISGSAASLCDKSGGQLTNLICDNRSHSGAAKSGSSGSDLILTPQKSTVITYALMPAHAYQMGHLEGRFDRSFQEADYQTEIFTGAESNGTLEINQTRFLIYH